MIITIIMAIKMNYEEPAVQMGIWLIASTELPSHGWHTFKYLFENPTC
jgi:hypothetical protein